MQYNGAVLLVNLVKQLNRGFVRALGASSCRNPLVHIENHWSPLLREFHISTTLSFSFNCGQTNRDAICLKFFLIYDSGRMISKIHSSTLNWTRLWARKRALRKTLHETQKTLPWISLVIQNIQITHSGQSYALLFSAAGTFACFDLWLGTMKLRKRKCCTKELIL